MRSMARVSLSVAALSLLATAGISLAQQQANKQPDLVAKRADIYCTGFISELPPRSELQIVGAEKEYIKHVFSQGDIVYLSKGGEQGVYPGSLYYVIRPLGSFRHPFTKKKIGTYVRELGMIRVIEAQDRTATAEVVVSCDTMMFGDLLRPYEAYVGPEAREEKPLNRYGPGTGDVTGQIILAPGYHEFLGANRVVHIDLGTRQGVQPGDHFTIFRKIDRHEGATNIPEDKVGYTRSSGFGSDRFRGGEFSLEADRRHDGKVIHEGRVVEHRPDLPRKVLGELVVLKVEKTAAVALITRSLAEVNIGDLIERAN
jgi:hypothetical protein